MVQWIDGHLLGTTFKHQGTRTRMCWMLGPGGGWGLLTALLWHHKVAGFKARLLLKGSIRFTAVLSLPHALCVYS